MDKENILHVSINVSCMLMLLMNKKTLETKNQSNSSFSDNASAIWCTTKFHTTLIPWAKVMLKLWRKLGMKKFKHNTWPCNSKWNWKLEWLKKQQRKKEKEGTWASLAVMIKIQICHTIYDLHLVMGWKWPITSAKACSINDSMITPSEMHKTIDSQIN